MADPATLEDPEHAARLAWIKKARGRHTELRLLGLAGIIVGASLMLWWKFTPTAPDWAMMTGMVVLGASWALFLFVIWDRWRWVKNNPYKPAAKQM